MKHLLFCFLILYLFSCGENNGSQHDHSSHQHENKKTDTTKKSIKSVAMANVGSNHIHIDYTAPAVRNRIIWGGLVPYKEVWVTGAHQATAISFAQDVLIEGKEIKKGKYAFFTIPDKDEWTIILNTRWKQHLADEYNEKEDVLRFKVKPLANTHTERLSYKVEAESDTNGKISMSWEKIKIIFEVKNKN